MATFSLGQLKNIVCYHFGSNAYRDDQNNKDKKKGSVVGWGEETGGGSY